MLKYHVDGSDDQPPVLFLHGFMGRGADWEDVTAAVQKHVRCIRVDLPGHGGSTGLPEGAYTFEGARGALVALLDALGIDRCALVGYSMGGRLALSFALEHPDRCRRLVIESASPGLRTADERAARLETDEARARQLETESLDAFLEHWYRQPLFESLAALPDLLRRILSARRRNDPHELARALRGMSTGRQPSYWDALERLAVPTLAVAGARDGRYVEVAEQMAILNPKIRTAILPNVGHNVHAEQPKTFLDLLADFLRFP